MYGAKFQIEPAKLMKRLWGENYYSPTERKWNKEGGDGYVRGFCHFILDPIYKVSFYNIFIFLYCIQLVLSNLFLDIRGNNSPPPMSRKGLLKTSIQPTIRVNFFLHVLYFVCLLIRSLMLSWPLRKTRLRNSLTNLESNLTLKKRYYFNYNSRQY